MNKLQLYYPLKPYYITQKYGETAFLEYYKTNGVIFAGHNGLDLVCHHGDPIRATHDGLAYYQIDSKQGHGVIVNSIEEFILNDGSTSRIKTIYWHMVDPNKEPKFKSPIQGRDGTPVKVGDILGYTDSTGLSDGDHLHFGLKPISTTGENILQNNGYQGAIDPAPYFNGKFAVDMTLNKPIRLDKNLHFGSENEDVKTLQKALKELGYYTYKDITGYYGSITQRAVLDFQYEIGVVKFGIESWFGFYFGVKSREALLKLINK